MKTSLVIASVLLAGVALEAAAFRINYNENQDDNHKQWSRYQLRDPNDGYPMKPEHQNGNQLQNAEYQYNQKLNRNNYNSNAENLDLQYGQNSNRNGYDSNAENLDQYGQNSNRNYNHYNNDDNKYNNENRHSHVQNDYSAERLPSQWQQGQNLQSTGLARKMVEKIAACQKIAADHNIGQRAEYLDDALAVDKDVVKVSDREFVTFYNATMKHLRDGQLEYLYVNPGRDTVMTQYRFGRVEAVGSFRSNVRDAGAGHYTVAMNDVYSNVTTGFDNALHAAVRPAQFRSADATLRTDDGAETRALDDALEHRYLGALKTALSAEVARSASRGVIAQIKSEIRKPVAAFYGAARDAKLYDMAWKEDGVSMEMANVGFQGAETAAVAAAAEPLSLTSALFYRKSENVYRARYHFTLAGLAWSSPLTVVETAAAKRTTVRSASFSADQVNVFVTVDKPYYGQPQQQQQPCAAGQIDAAVEVSGLRYDFNESVQSEFAAMVESRLQRYIEHSLEDYVRETLKRELCYGNMQ